MGAMALSQAFGMLAAGTAVSDWPTAPWEWAWFAFGMVGNLIFGGRFFLQWIHSERLKESRIPLSFWWLSVIGTVILFIYFCHMRQWVALLGNGPQLIPYIRNLMLIHQKRAEHAKLAAAADDTTILETPDPAVIEPRKP